MIDATMTKRMEEATRLTRAGKLHEAMALLQGSVPEARSTETRSTETRRSESPNNVYQGGNTFDGIWEVVGKQDTGTKPASEARSATGTFTAGSFSNRVGTRDYKLYVPSGYHGQALPLVVMLHGCTQNPDDFAAGTEMNRLAEEQPCCVLYPAQPMTANHSKCWNWFKAEDQQREGGEPAILAGMTRQIIDTYGLDAGRVYVAGLSAGAAMATTLAMTYPDLFAAVGVHSGLPHGVAKSLPDALGAMQGGTGPLGGGNQAQGAGWASNVPAIIFHGDRDTTVHPSNADRVAAQYSTSRQAGATVEKGKVANGHGYTCTTHRDASGKPCLEQWRVHGAGHAWSGGSKKGSYTDPQGPDATREMLRFFCQHRQIVS
ncbi:MULTISPECIES: PHB depolymerase family esterase [unclassified Halomonas]|uniref:extracellular catalytic domain type 1 short-chain-length polyhydroxyalkanoate depolymerase n=1 Tax=unclassified Halomonas TaxID=2609666 RepID=UPI0007D91F7B|nr:MULTISPECIES: PHB depolymerase family esterase [unclassified Halomonas]MBT2788935.1 PHB depolymerase family esterase [Halomonas sp. ISL-106]MBT2799136.1 PHB depolymerase family esterase [Halomonas sp. ISL-104]OAL60227.1 plasmid partitioning protein [Halomonas sp. ALS9]